MDSRCVYWDRDSAFLATFLTLRVREQVVQRNCGGVDYYAESQAVQSSVASGKLRGRALSVHVFLGALTTLTSSCRPR